MHMRVSDRETDNGENDRMQEANTNANAMHMMTCDEMHDMNKMQNERKNPTTKEISYPIAENGKNWSYKYGKLHPGCYNTPPLREDLVPRSRIERTPDIRNGDCRGIVTADVLSVRTSHEANASM